MEPGDEIASGFFILVRLSFGVDTNNKCFYSTQISFAMIQADHQFANIKPASSEKYHSFKPSFSK